MDELYPKDSATFMIQYCSLDREMNSLIIAKHGRTRTSNRINFPRLVEKSSAGKPLAVGPALCGNVSRRESGKRLN